MKDRNTLEKSRQIFREYLDRKGLRHTAERYMVLEVVSTIADRFSIDILCRNMESANCHVAKATVYSTVRCLCSCGLVRELQESGREHFYQYSAIPRVNCVCRYCGKVKEIKDNELATFLGDKKIRGFRQEFYTMTIYGLCTQCHRKTEKNNNNRNFITPLSKTHKK